MTAESIETPGHSSRWTHGWCCPSGHDLLGSAGLQFTEDRSQHPGVGAFIGALESSFNLELTFQLCHWKWRFLQVLEYGRELIDKKDYNKNKGITFQTLISDLGLRSLLVRSLFDRRWRTLFKAQHGRFAFQTWCQESTMIHVYNPSIFHDQSAKPSEVCWGIQSCPLQTANVLTHLTFLSAQVREMIASSALKKGNHFPWSEAQKVEQLSQICNFWAGFPLNLCPICFFLMRSLALSQYWNKIPKIPVLPHRISHSAKMATESWNNSSMRMDIYTYTYSLWYFICYIYSTIFFVCIYVYRHVTIHTICVLCKFKSMGWKGINPSSFLFFCETWTPSGYNL